jgi:hypothetical protein
MKASMCEPSPMLAARSVGPRLSVLHAASFIGIGVYMPFFPIWLQAKALSPTMIGIVMAIPIVVRILAIAPLLTLADRSFGLRRLLIASHLGQMFGYPVLMALDDGLSIAGIVAVLAVAHTAVVPGNDLVTTTALWRHRNLDYGRIRGFGSIAFLAASIGAGYLIDAAGTGIVLWILALAPILGLLLVGSGAAVIRFGVLSVDPGLTATFLLQALHGLSFGASHLGAMAALPVLAPELARGRAQGLLGTAAALGMATATFASGDVYRIAGPTVFAVMTPLGALGLVLTLMAMRSLRAQPQSIGEGG